MTPSLDDCRDEFTVDVISECILGVASDPVLEVDLGANTAPITKAMFGKCPLS